MRMVFVVYGLLLGFAMAADEPPMPAWDADEREKMLEDGWLAGGSLLFFEPLPDEVVDLEVPPEWEVATPDELAIDESEENIVGEEYLTEYFAERPERFLVDPQKFLGTEERTALAELLDRHASDTSIDLFVYVFGGDQQIPSDVREEEVVERLFSEGKPAVVLYYYLGAPQRAAIYLSPVITDAVSAAEQKRALESSVIRAFDREEPGDQLESFLVQMSIRAYWMGRMAAGTAIETMDVIPDDRAVDSLAKRKEPKVAPKKPLPWWVKIAAAAVVSAVGLVLFVWSAFMIFRARARYVFPEFEVEPRIGGNHAAGIGAVISFSSSAIPPAIQRDQVPDYVRRA